MRAQTADGSYSVVVEAAVLQEIDRFCTAAGKVETGGVLVGRYSEDRTTALVLEVTSPPADSRQGSAWFKRGIAGLRALLRRRWNARERTYYLGEWHFHPARTVVPSGDDFEQMASIARTNDYRCREPLMMIFGAARAANGVRTARMFVCPADEPPAEVFPEGSVAATSRSRSSERRIEGSGTPKTSL